MAVWLVGFLEGRVLELKLIVDSMFFFSSCSLFKIRLIMRLIQGIDEIFLSTSFWISRFGFHP
jgi:hypothetical protein